MTKPMNPQPAIVYLDIAQVALNPNNPRKRMDEATLSDLAKSIEQVGVLQPVMVRQRAEDKPKSRFKPNKAYELISGHRRLLAATIAGLETIPAIIKDLTDDQAFEVAIMENLQREDVDPLDESAAFNAMMESGRYSVEDIAGKVGKSTVFVHQRMKLSSLIPELQAKMAEGVLGLTNAMMIAKLRKEDQSWICKNNLYRGTTTDLKDRIETQIYNKLDSAPFNLTDAELVPSAGPCSTCAKRTAVSPTLFPEIEPSADRCLDRPCFMAKTEAGLAQQCRDAINSGSAEFLVFSYHNRDAAKALASEGLKTISDWSVREVDMESRDQRHTIYNAFTMRTRKVSTVRIIAGHACQDANGQPVTWLAPETEPQDDNSEEALTAKIEQAQSAIEEMDDMFEKKLSLAWLEYLNENALSMTHGWSNQELRGALAMILLSQKQSPDVLQALAGELGIEYDGVAASGLVIPIMKKFDKAPELVTKHLPSLLVGYITTNFTQLWRLNPSEYSDGYMVRSIIESSFSANGLTDKQSEIRNELQEAFKSKIEPVQAKLAEYRTKLEAIQAEKAETTEVDA
jgi:ParB/RepB/Spo0J family partition protein